MVASYGMLNRGLQRDIQLLERHPRKIKSYLPLRSLNVLNVHEHLEWLYASQPQTRNNADALQLASDRANGDPSVQRARSRKGGPTRAAQHHGRSLSMSHGEKEASWETHWFRLYDTQLKVTQEEQKSAKCPRGG